jgi:hypothetical protein
MCADQEGQAQCTCPSGDSRCGNAHLEECVSGLGCRRQRLPSQEAHMVHKSRRCATKIVAWAMVGGLAWVPRTMAETAPSSQANPQTKPGGTIVVNPTQEECKRGGARRCDGPKTSLTRSAPGSALASSGGEPRELIASRLCRPRTSTGSSTGSFKLNDRRWGCTRGQRGLVPVQFLTTAGAH